MPKKISMYHVIDYRKKHTSASSDICFKATHGRFKDNNDSFYYCVGLESSNKPISLPVESVIWSNPVSLTCIEQHLTFLSYDGSDDHYTGIFMLKRNGEEKRFKLHVYLTSDFDAIGDVSWSSMDTDQTITLTPQHIQDIIDYTLLESNPTLNVLREIKHEYKQLITQQEANYQKESKEYERLIFDDEVSTDKLLEHIDKIKNILQQLKETHVEHEKKYSFRIEQFDRAIQFIQNLNQIDNTSAISIEEESGKQTEIMISAAVSVNAEKPHSIPKRIARGALSTAMQEDLTKNIRETIADFDKLLSNSPAQRNEDNSINIDYITHLVEIDHTHQKLNEQNVLLPLRGDANLINTIQELSQKSEEQILKGIYTLFIITQETDEKTCSERLKPLGHYVPKLKDKSKILKFILHADKSEFLAFLLDNEFEESAKSTYKNTHTLFKSEPIPSCSELLLQKQTASKCLSVMAKKVSLDLFKRGVDGRPLACKIFCVNENSFNPLVAGKSDPLNDFRQYCFEIIPALKRPRFYDDLLEYLEEENRGSDSHIKENEILMVRISKLQNIDQKQNQSDSLTEEQKEIGYQLMKNFQFAELIAPTQSYLFFMSANKNKLDELANYLEPTVIATLKEKLSSFTLSQDNASLDLEKTLKEIESPEFKKLFYMYIQAPEMLYHFLNENLRAMKRYKAKAISHSEIELQKKISGYYLERFLEAEACISSPGKTAKKLQEITEQVEKSHQELAHVSNMKEGKKRQQRIENLARKTKECMHQLERLTQDSAYIKQILNEDNEARKQEFLSILGNENHLLTDNVLGRITDQAPALQTPK